MASVAQHWLRHGEKSAFHFGMMSGVAIDAPYIVLKVLGAKKVSMLLAEFVAAEAALAGLLTRKRLKADDLGNISAALSVRFAWTVACLAALILHAAMIEERLPVRTMIVTACDLLVACAAGIGAGIEGRIAGITNELLFRGVLSIRLGLLPGILFRMFSRISYGEQRRQEDHPA